MTTAPTPALDPGFDNPDLFVGEAVAPEHDLDLSAFLEESDDDEQPPTAAAPAPTGASYFLAPALADQGLRGEVNARFPHRDKTSDGWIGDARHQAESFSDHNPDWSAPAPWTGIVRAIDVDVDDGDPAHDLRTQLLKAVIGDRRAWYIISNGIIYSATYGWAPRRYTGSDSHFGHLHVSLLHRVGEFDTSAWWDAPKIQHKPVSLSEVRDRFQAALAGRPVKFSNSVGRIQRCLNRHHGEHLTVDGIAGKATLDAWGRFEDRLPGKPVGRVRIPDAKTLPALARGHFRIID